jgi:hypothetical protein
MTPGAREIRDSDTLFIGGPQPTDRDREALAHFGLNKNYRIIFPEFDPADAEAGPIGFHAVVTDGLTQSIVVANGRLWKRDRTSPAVLLFAEQGVLIRMSGKGRLMIKAMRGQYHDHGFELAREAVSGRASRKPGRIPVIAPIGGMIMVLDIRAVRDSFANAE